MIYLIKCLESNLCKIGYSNDPIGRLKQIQTSYPMPLTLCYTIDGDLSKERFIHDKFKEYHKNGEWFVLNSSIIEYFENKGDEEESPIRFQRNTDGYFDATALLVEFNNLSSNKPKKMEDFKKLKETKQLCEYVEINEKLTDKAIISSLKGTWMHPFVFIDFALWLSSEYKNKFISWFYNNHFKTRNLVGDHYKEMCAELLNQRNVLQKETSFYHYIQEANMIKELAGVSNRNETNEAQLDLLNTLQKANIKLIRNGVSKEKRYDELRNLRNLIS